MTMLSTVTTQLLNVLSPGIVQHKRVKATAHKYGLTTYIVHKIRWLYESLAVVCAIYLYKMALYRY